MEADPRPPEGGLYQGHARAWSKSKTGERQGDNRRSAQAPATVFCRHSGLLLAVAATLDLLMPTSKYEELGQAIGKLVTEKQIQYGDSVGKTGDILRILYPNGVQPYQYDDALLVVRVLDKLSRISQRGPEGQDLGGESPWMDVSGYGLLGANKDAR